MVFSTKNGLRNKKLWYCECKKKAMILNIRTMTREMQATKLSYLSIHHNDKRDKELFDK